jgi:hypothetical protein
MVAHERHITVTEHGQITVSGLPVRPGQRVRVTVAVEGEDRQQLAARFQDFFARVQALPQVQKLSEDELAQEIAAYRSRDTA